MDAFAWMAERRIAEAMERGEFQDLPGAGRHLALNDDPLVPDEMWLAHKILKNAGCVPEEVERRKEIHHLEDLLADLPDETERVRAQTRLALLRTRAEMSRGGGGTVAADPRYQDGLTERLSRTNR